jgi:hypothetical protein
MPGSIFRGGVIGIIGKNIKVEVIRKTESIIEAGASGMTGMSIPAMARAEVNIMKAGVKAGQTLCS